MEENEVQEEKREYTDVERVAMDIGWNPDFEGENAKTAEEFIKASRDITDAYRKQIKNSSEKISLLEKGFLDFKEILSAEHEAKQKAMEAKIEELNRMREKALDEEDVPEVRKIESQIRTESAALAKTIRRGEAESKQTKNPDFDEWNKKNPWYGTNDEMTAYAEAQFENDLSLRGLSAKRVYAKIEARVREEFPEEFESEKKPQKKTAVESGGSGPRRSSKITYSDLDAETRRTVDEMLDMYPPGALEGTKAERRQKYVDGMVRRGFSLQ